MRAALHPIDGVVLVAYLVLMAGIGAYFMRFLEAEKDFLKGGNRVEWWVAGLASFMSGFSVWTFTGGAGFAYRHGVIGVFLMLLAVPAFFLGSQVFAVRWRRARVTTVVEYVRERFGEGTHRTFSWIMVPSQLLFGAARLFALASFLSVALGLPVAPLIVGCGVVILAYTTLGGYWAVCFTDMFQFLFLFPIAVVLAGLSLGAVGGLDGFVAAAPPGFLDPIGGEYGWLFLVAYSISQAIGYNNFSNAQRYFCADNERSARKIAWLSMALFTVGSFVFYLPPLAARMVMPELGSTPNGLPEPSEAAYMAMGLRLLPAGLVGVLLAAMLASSMASLSATTHLVAGVLAKDLYQAYFRPEATERQMLGVSRVAALSVGVTMIAVGVLLSLGATSLFRLLFVFDAIFLVPLGLPLLYGLLVPWGPWWCALFAYGVGAATALGTSLVAAGAPHWNETHLVAIPAAATTVAFFVPALARKGVASARVRAFFSKLGTPIDVERELARSPITGRGQLALVGRVTTGMGIAFFGLLLALSEPRELRLVAGYATATTLLGLAFVAAGRPRRRDEPPRAPGDEEERRARIAGE